MDLKTLRKLVLKQSPTSEEIEKALADLGASVIDFGSVKTETLMRVFSSLSSTLNGKTSSTLSTLNSLLQGVTVERERLERYRLIRELLSRLPELGQALSVYMDDVLSPDDYLKESLVVYSPTDDSAAVNYVSDLLKKYNLEEKIPILVGKTLLYGDFFVELREAALDWGNLREELVIRKEIANKKVVMESFIQQNEHVLTEEEEQRKTLLLLFWEPDRVVPLIYQDMVLGYVVVRPYTSPSAYTLSTSSPIPDVKQNEEIVRRVVEYLLSKKPELEAAVKDSPHLFDDLAALVTNYAVSKHLEASVYFVPPERMEYFRIPSAKHYPYGESIFSNNLIIGRLLAVLEHSLAIYRLTRAPERRIFKVEVGEERDVTGYIEKVIRKTKQKEVFLQDPVSVDTLISELSLFEDYYVPTKDGREFFTIESIPGGELTAKIEDIEYLRKKLVSGTGIPAIYLVQEDTPESKFTLAQENVKFARTIVKLQKVFTHHLTSLVKKICALTDPNMLSKIHNTTITLKPPIAIQIAIYQELFASIQTVVESLSNLVPEVDKKKFARRYLTHLISPQELDDLIRTSKLEKAASTKVKAEAAEGEGEAAGVEEVEF